LQGTNLTNFMGSYAYVATGKEGFEAVAVAELDEPAAVIGSEFHRVAYPRNFARHRQRDGELQEAHHHPGNVLDVQLRGEYLYAALGPGGFRAYDVANIANKGFSERLVTAPVSPVGQRLYVKTKNATAVASPSTLAIDPARTRLPENEEQAIHPLYAYLYVTDAEEGLVVIGDADPKSKSPGVSTLLDGNPSNNFLKRALAFNPEGKLAGARRITLAGTYAYILCNRGLVVVDLSNPLAPRIAAEMGAPDLVEPQGIQVQFRYAFVVDREGLKVLDISDLSQPRRIAGTLVPLPDARNLYLARTYAYVAGGKQGLAIIDIEKPEQPKLDQVFNAGGKLSDTRDVKVGMTSASVFAYVADGKNGFRVVQLISPETVPGHYGFSPRPNPQLIASYHTHGPALAVSEGTDRDRAVDESGNQLAVFGRRGARPFNRAEAERLYLRNGQPYTVR
ncbi:MAG: LVIVD repeat-containing protein, partial [Candidatus Acidiferrales bacterium]